MLLIHYCAVFFGLIGLWLASVNGDEESVQTYGDFAWSSCTNKTYLTTIEYVNIRPNPVVIPGQLILDVLANATQDINSPAKVEFVIERKLGALWVAVPCGEGNCTIDDICYMMSVIYPPDQPCPDSLAQHGVACHCPIKAGIYDITDFAVNLFLHVPGLLTGDYHLQLAFFSDDVEITCFNVWFSLLAE